MSGKSHNTPTEWVDPDDAPEWTAETFQRATPMIGGREVTIEEFRRAVKNTAPPSTANAKPKVVVTIEYDDHVVASFHTTGEGWQQRLNHELREWLQSNPLP